MDFHIQLSNPKTIKPEKKKCEDLSDALQQIYPMWTEDLYISWNHTSVAIGYKYDVSVIMTGILEMLEALISSQTGQDHFGFASSTFHTDWEMAWEDDRLTISSKWFSVHGGIKSILNERYKLTLSRIGFLSEWKGLLNRIIEDVKKAGIQLSDQEEWTLIQRLEASIEDYGVLYKGLGDDDIVT